MCSKLKSDYVSSTATIMLINRARSILTVAYVGDSQICLASSAGSETIQNNSESNIKKEELRISWLTRQHKPDIPEEMERIKSRGGDVVRIHDAPYMR